jgi:hypothetical protein
VRPKPRPLTIPVQLHSNAGVDGVEVSASSQEEDAVSYPAKGSGHPIDQAAVVIATPKGMLWRGFLLRRSSGPGSKLDPVDSRHGERSSKKAQTSSEKTELVIDAVSGLAGFISEDAISYPTKLRLISGFATPHEEVSGSSFSGEVSPVLSSPARYGSFDASRVPEFDLKPRVEDQALELSDALGSKSPKIGPSPRPLQVYQRSRWRLPKPNKPSGSSPVTSIAVSPKAGSTKGAAVGLSCGWL